MEKYTYQAKDEVGAPFRGEVAGDSLMDMAIQDLLQAGKISRETARVYAKNEKF